MKKSNFTESQIVFILKQAEDGTAISEVCRKAGISDAAFYIGARNMQACYRLRCGGCNSLRKRMAG